MILSIGEILGDMVGQEQDSSVSFQMFCGGAPFNVAVNSKMAGAKVGFIGCIGDDPVGRFLKNQTKKYNLDFLDIQTDDKRNTTIAFVTLNNGERDFAFYRHDTADYHILIDEEYIKMADIVHLGSLMLSEEYGRNIAKDIVKITKKYNKILSFDVNFRKDIFRDLNTAKTQYEPYIKAADIVKLSDDELEIFTGTKNIDEAVKIISHKNQMVVITLGKKGSCCYYNDIKVSVPTIEVKPVDTTGAGDAFFGTFLALIENKEITKENIEIALIKANKKGAETTLFKGALKR